MHSGKIGSLVRATLNLSRTEHEIHSFLKEYPLLVRNAFNAWAWNYSSVTSEFALGNKYRVDFLVLGADSGQWHATFVELKSPSETPFTAKGVVAAGLNRALSQIHDRMLWVETNQTAFRQSLSSYFEKRTVCAQCSNAVLHTLAATEILDERTYIDYRYVVVVGRRAMITPDHQKRRHINDQVEIATYDRLLDVADKLDKAGTDVEVIREGGDS